MSDLNSIDVISPNRVPRRTRNVDFPMRQLICQKFDASQPIKKISNDLEINYRTVTSIIIEVNNYNY